MPFSFMLYYFIFKIEIYKSTLNMKSYKKTIDIILILWYIIYIAREQYKKINLKKFKKSIDKLKKL